MANHIMIDIETMGQGSDAAIVAIGAVAFDECGVGDEFYERISLEDAAKYGSIDASTVLWWMKQEDAAREEITKEGTISPHIVQHMLSVFIFKNRDKEDEVSIWGNGSDFDNVILENWFKAMGLTAPWKFYENRCYRTIKSLNRDIEMKREGTHHNALDDARSQAKHLIAIAKAKNIKL